jgi:hypothetical protein
LIDPQQKRKQTAAGLASFSTALGVLATFAAWQSRAGWLVMAAIAVAFVGLWLGVVAVLRGRADRSARSLMLAAVGIGASLVGAALAIKAQVAPPPTPMAPNFNRPEIPPVGPRPRSSEDAHPSAANDRR